MKITTEKIRRPQKERQRGIQIEGGVVCLGLKKNVFAWRA
jgi:hypothetical protein